MYNDIPGCHLAHSTTLTAESVLHLRILRHKAVTYVARPFFLDDAPIFYRCVCQAGISLTKRYRRSKKL